MARTYGKLLTSIWTDSEFASLSGATQRLYMMLLASPKMSSAGVLPLQVARWAKTARDTTLEGTERAFTELLDRRFVVADNESEEVWIRSFIKHDKGYANANLSKGIVSAITNGIESVDIRALAADEMMKCLREGPSKPLTEDLMEVLTKALGNGVPETFPPTPSPVAAAATTSSTGSTLLGDAVRLLIDEKVKRANATSPSYRAALERDVPDEVRPLLLETLRAHPDADAEFLASVALTGCVPPSSKELEYAGDRFGAAIAVSHLRDGREPDPDTVREEAAWSNPADAYVTAAVAAYVAAMNTASPSLVTL